MTERELICDICDKDTEVHVVNAPKKIYSCQHCRQEYYYNPLIDEFYLKLSQTQRELLMKGSMPVIRGEKVQQPTIATATVTDF